MMSVTIQARHEKMLDVRQRRVKTEAADELKSSSQILLVKQPNTNRRKLLTYFYMVAGLLVVGFVVLFVIIPAIIHYSTAVQTNLIFLSLIRWPLWYVNVSNPESCGIKHTRNFEISSTDNVKLGVWHALPVSLQEEAKKQRDNVTYFESSLANGLPVIMYLHGNSGTRGVSYRIQLYNILRNLNYHVITFDYRNYADSSSIRPTENGVVSDARHVYKWLRARVPAHLIIVWGHSIGTGVAVKFVHKLCEEGDQPSGLILEAPFNNLREEIKCHPLTTIHRYMPYFDQIFLDAVEPNIEFASDRRIGGITIPIQIFHAEDDKIIPISLAQKLYNAAITDRPAKSGRVSFHKFDRQFGYGHKYICRAPELPRLVSDFVQQCQRRN